MAKLHIFTLSVILLTVFMVHAKCDITPIPFNVTVGYSYQWKIDSSFTTVGYEFLTNKTSGVAVFTDFSYSDQFNSYTVPSNLKGYDLYGVVQMDMQKVNIPLGGASFSFTHFYVFGILNVNPKDLVLVGVDMDMKKFVPINYVTNAAQFTQIVTLPIERKVYTFAILGLTKELSSQFGVDTFVNYRASIRYDIHTELNQYLSAFVNRPLNYPAHEYVAQKVDNRLALPSSELVEIASFSFNPMFTPSYSGRMVTNDFMFSFDLSKGFVDRNGKKVEIDFLSLKCLYVLDEKQGFVERPSSDVFPGWQKLSCTPYIGRNNFFPKYITIVANRK